MFVGTLFLKLFFLILTAITLMGLETMFFHSFKQAFFSIKDVKALLIGEC